MAKFKTQYEEFKRSPEINSGEILVERVGYISARDRIENLLLAGHRLENFRKEQYDFESVDKIDETFTDPTRNKNYDMADAFQDTLALNAKFKNKSAETKVEEKGKEVSKDTEKTPE